MLPEPWPNLRRIIVFGIFWIPALVPWLGDPDSYRDDAPFNCSATIGHLKIALNFPVNIIDPG